MAGRLRDEYDDRFMELLSQPVLTVHARATRI
jgi:hypothetical protein